MNFLTIAKSRSVFGLEEGGRSCKKMVSADLIKSEYPLHFLVWTNSYRDLEQELIDRVDHDKEKRDPRGRTPLMLAVTLGHVESVRILLNYDANVNCESSDGWTVVQEAVATGDPELVRLVLDRREQQRMSSRTAGIPELLRRLDQAPDFYVEMKWEFTSWVPLVSRMCPSDTYRVYKQGANVRIDTTLLGFDHTSWQRGSRSYVFQGQADGATMMEVDHDARQVYVERMHVTAARLPSEEGDDVSGGAAATSDEAIAHRLTSPIVSTFVDTDKISFERNKAGMWGWRSDRTESVNGHHCKVFSASNVELVTRTRTEHLTETDKARSRGAPPRTPLQSFLGIAEATTPLIAVGSVSGEEDEEAEPVEKQPSTTTTNNPSGLTVEEYFEPGLGAAASIVDVGRPREIASKVQRFRATLWLSETYPLSLQEQVMPVVDLMAISSTHFAKLRDFVRLQLPAGFPVKVEIPLFHVLNARVTFGNVLGLDEPEAAPGVQRVHEADGRITCVVDDRCFAPPAGYTLLGSDSRRHFSVEEEDDLLQFAIQQSLIEAGTERDEVDIWEALKGQRPNPPSPTNYVGEEERQLQRAIQASLAMYQGSLSPENDDCNVEVATPTMAASTADASPEDEEGIDSDLQMALMLSEQQRLEEEERRLQEQKTLEEILRLSIIDK